MLIIAKYYFEITVNNETIDFVSLVPISIHFASFYAVLNILTMFYHVDHNNIIVCVELLFYCYSETN